MIPLSFTVIVLTTFICMWIISFTTSKPQKKYPLAESSRASESVTVALLAVVGVVGFITVLTIVSAMAITIFK